MLTTSRKKAVGDRSGKAMVQKRLARPAPSIAAASISERGIGEERPEVGEAHELGREAERILALRRGYDRLRRRPHEEHDGHRELRGEQEVGQPAPAEDDALLHCLRVRLLELLQLRVAAGL